MPAFSTKSLAALEGVHPKLVQLADEAIKYFDFAVLNGVRTEAQEAEYVKQGLSTTMNSKHLKQADGYGHAFDFAPCLKRGNEVCAQLWDDPKYNNEILYLAGFLKGLAAALGIGVRLGADFNRNNDVLDDGFKDTDHIELDEVVGVANN